MHNTTIPETYPEESLRSVMDRYGAYLKVMTALSGELSTTATWMRNFITQHPDYKQDSVVNDRITYDLMVACDRISKGETCAELTGILHSRTVRDIETCPGTAKRKSESEDVSVKHRKMEQNN